MKWDDSLKIFVLSAAIRWWMYKYYNQYPVISDNTFDTMYRELEKLERKKGHVAYDSPTVTPGS